MAKIIFSYRVAWDDGKAPCVDDGLLSLAICKSRLRGIIAKEQLKHVSHEYYLLGLCGKRDLPSILFYARLNSPTPIIDFYQWYTTRKDSLYSIDEQGTLKRNQRYACVHAGGSSSDLSQPYVLTSDDFYYFGKSAIKIPQLIADQYHAFLPGGQEHKPAAPYGESDLYKGLHSEIMTLIQDHPLSEAQPHLPYPPTKGCIAEDYAEGFIRAQGYYKRENTVIQHAADMANEKRGYCQDCVNAAACV